MKKQDIRILAKQLRSNIEKNEKAIKDQKIVKKIINNPKYIEAKLIGVFYPINSEINVRLIQDNNKRFAYPKIVNDKIIFIEIDQYTKWEMSKFGINEPKNGKIVSDNIDLLIVPALAINKKKHRIGYGKGYYDKFIINHKPKYTIGIIYEELIREFKEEPNDVALDEVISG